MRRARSAPPARATRASISLAAPAIRLRHLREQIEDGAERGGARAGFRQQRGSGKVERLRDGAQHAHRRIAGAAFDLRQIALRRFGGLRQLPARHAALGAVAPHLAPDGGEELWSSPLSPLPWPLLLPMR
jgi:hypothetical protein